MLKLLWKLIVKTLSLYALLVEGWVKEAEKELGKRQKEAHDTYYGDYDLAKMNGDPWL